MQGCSHGVLFFTLIKRLYLFSDSRLVLVASFAGVVRQLVLTALGLVNASPGHLRALIDSQRNAFMVFVELILMLKVGCL